MRGDLSKIDGIVDIQTNVPERICSFKITGPDVDYKSKLAEFAESNEHLAGYEIQ